MDPSALPIRALVVAVICGVIFLAYSVWTENRSGKIGWFPSIVGYLAALGWRAASVLVGGLGSIRLLEPIVRLTNPDYIGLLAIPGLAVGAWVSDIGVQLFDKAARRAAGKPARPVIGLGKSTGEVLGQRLPKSRLHSPMVDVAKTPVAPAPGSG